MEVRTLELHVISAKDLKKVKKIGPQTCYAVAYIGSSDKKASRLDTDGGVNPTWNAQLTLACEDELLHRAGSYITVEIYSHGYFGNKLIGTSRISLSEVDKQARAAALPKRFASLVRRPSGAVKGVLNVAVKIGEMRDISQSNTSREASSLMSHNFKDSQQILPAMGHSRISLSQSSRPNIENLTPNSPRKLYLQHSEADRAESVYPPRWPSSIVISISSPKTESYPMLAYPISASPPASPAHQYGDHQFGTGFGTQDSGGLNWSSGTHQQSFYHSKSQACSLHKVHYSSPRVGGCGGSKRSCRSRGNRMGLLGGVVGGLVLL